MQFKIIIMNDRNRRLLIIYFCDNMNKYKDKLFRNVNVGGNLWKIKDIILK